MESTRFVDRMHPISYSYSDLIVLYGNEQTRSTFAGVTDSPVENVTPTTHHVHSPGVKTEKSASHFVWFGSAGAVHKGLDLLLPVFATRPKLHLHVCGDLEREKSFYEYFAKTLNSSPNIHYHGFVDVNSDKFKTIMDQVAFCVLPSCSEGIATSVLTTMANGGTIPIVSRQAGIDLVDHGILLEDLTVDGIEAALAAASKMTVDEINARSRYIWSFCRDNYTLEKFAGRLQNILERYLKK